MDVQVICPDCEEKRYVSVDLVKSVFPHTGGRCVTCYDKFCGWQYDLLEQMTDEQKQALDRIPLPNAKRVTKFFKKIERGLQDGHSNTTKTHAG